MENIQNREVHRGRRVDFWLSVSGVGMGVGVGVRRVAADVEWGFLTVPYVMKYKKPLEVRCAITLCESP